MHDKILDFLRRRQEYVSGEDISSHLKISRQALWKHIQLLRDSGYDITAIPHLGYKLISMPDRLYPSEVRYGLNTKLIGKHIYYFDNIGSTMDMAMQLGMKGASEGTLIIAESQTKARGRLGREWLSPRYSGIYLSLILRPEIVPNQSPILTLLSAVSTIEAIKETVDLDARIKWPNDIMLHNRKLGGILTELNAEMDCVRFAVIGIGLNVNNDKKSLVAGAISLRELKNENVNRIYLLQNMLRKIEMNYLLFKEKGGQPILEQWRHYNITLGKRIKVSFQNELIEGEAVDIDSDGGLLLRKDSGITRKIMSGDVIHCR